MAYSEILAERIESILDSVAPAPPVAKKMFGGIGYLLGGNMACGVHQENLIVRVGPDAYDAALDAPGAGVFDITGRPMRGWIMIHQSFVDDDETLTDWVSKGVAFAMSLPPK